MLPNMPMAPPMNAAKPLVIQPQRPIGGVPKILTGKHHENQKNKNNIITPKKTKAIDILRVLPPLK